MDSLCQKVYKIKIETGIRKFSATGRGSEVWKKLCTSKEYCRTSERMPKRTLAIKKCQISLGKRKKVHFDSVTLVYNASKLTVDQMNQKMKEMNPAA